MITSDMRKRAVEHVDQFYDRNFTILVANDKDYKIYLKSIIKGYESHKR